MADASRDDGVDGPRPVSPLPVFASAFVGRQREVGDVVTLIERYRLVTLTGPGGSGKTRLALRVAEVQPERFPGGVWFVELAGLGIAGDVASQVAKALGLREQPGRSILDQIARSLPPSPCLVVLDNCEHVIEEAAAVVDALVRKVPGLTLLATSRQPLDVDGEVVWGVPPMAPSGDGLALFADRAARARPGFALDDACAPVATLICARLDGAPLAIELAAALVRSTDLATVLAGLDDRFALLDRGHGRVGRHATIQASLAWSYDLLTDVQRHALRALSVFSGAFLPAAADSVAGPSGRDVVRELVDRSLVQFEPGTSGPGRYRMPETVKAFAVSLLIAAGEDTAARERHLWFQVAVCAEAVRGIEGSDAAVWLERLASEQDDIRSALDWAIETGRIDQALTLAADAGAYWQARWLAREATMWLDRVLAAGDDGPPAARARVAWRAAATAMYSLDIERAARLAVSARELAESGDDLGALARAIDIDASVRQFDDPVGTGPDFLRAHGLAVTAGDAWCAADALQKAAWSEVYRHRWQGAVELDARARPFSERTQNPLLQAFHDMLEGWAAMVRGDQRLAIDCLERAAELTLGVGALGALGQASQLLAEASLRAGDTARARAARHRMVESFGQDPAPVLQMLISGMDVILDLHDGIADRTIGFLRGVLDHFTSEGASWVVALGARSLAHAAAVAGDRDGAVAAAIRLRSIAAASDSVVFGAAADLLEAVAERGAGRPDRAEPLARAALMVFHAEGCVPDALDALGVVAGCLLDLGNPAAALRLLAAVTELRRSTGNQPGVPALYAHPVAHDALAAAEASGDDAARHVAHGRASTLDTAVAWTARNHARRRRPNQGWASLTPTEITVAGLVALGRTNPEIATELVVSRATVKTHVAHILAKLGATTRAEVASIVTRQQGRQ